MPTYFLCNVEKSKGGGSHKETSHHVCIQENANCTIFNTKSHTLPPPPHYYIIPCLPPFPSPLHFTWHTLFLAMKTLSMITFLFVLFTTFLALASSSRYITGGSLRLPSEASRFFHEPEKGDTNEGTRWAVLFAGSNGYWNYRHQVKYNSDILFLYLCV